MDYTTQEKQLGGTERAIMAKMLSAKETTEKQTRRLVESIPDIERGIARTTVSPTEKAAENLDKAKANFVRAIDSGKTKERLLAVSKEDWQRKTLAKVDRISTGISEAADRVEDFHVQRIAHQEGISRELDSMPTRTDSDMEARMLKQIRGMRGNWYKRNK
tara:strand:+ start:136 stop:618 length:483 start_codon:yes stop_codon:yes gene_type:complete